MKVMTEDEYFDKLRTLLDELKELRKTNYAKGINDKTEELFNEMNLLKQDKRVKRGKYLWHEF